MMPLPHTPECSEKSEIKTGIFRFPPFDAASTLLRMDTKKAWHEARGSHLRKGRWSESGRIYLLTTTTLERERRFLDFNIASEVVKAFHAAPLWDDNVLLAWVLMPDHWHGLIQLGDHQDLARTVSRFKAITSLRCNQLLKRNGAIWQAGFYDHALRRDESVVDAARYIVMNPVRAGLVRRIGDYPFWNAVWM